MFTELDFTKQYCVDMDIVELDEPVCSSMVRVLKVASVTFTDVLIAEPHLLHSARPKEPKIVSKEAWDRPKMISDSALAALSVARLDTAARPGGSSITNGRTGAWRFAWVYATPEGNARSWDVPRIRSASAGAHGTATSQLLPCTRG